MLDSYTSSMCNDSWGSSSFARCLIEVNSEADLVDVVTIGIPSLSEDDFTKETIHVEYEWRPPRCDTDLILDCPDLVNNSIISLSYLSNKAVSAVAGEATGNGTVNGIMNDEIGEGTIEGAGEIGSEPDDYSGDGGV
ncbi:hypothetical protein Tco_0633898 [Tanacetum coccineum]